LKNAVVTKVHGIALQEIGQIEPHKCPVHQTAPSGAESDIVWSVSSCKAEYPVGHLRDGFKHTFWQSDGGPLPHTITASLRRRQKVASVFVYLSAADESYCPKNVSVAIGNDLRSLKEVSRMLFQEAPDGLAKNHAYNFTKDTKT
jgi:hypothetical protein